MSYLCMDEYGNVYVAATHRSDGQGVEARPETVKDFADPGFQNPYLAQDNSAHKEGAMVKAVADNIDKQNEAISGQMRQIKKARARREMRGLELGRMKHDSLLAEAITQQLAGADFNQLAIVDAQYGAKHLAMLEGMGEAVADSDLNYIQDAEMSQLEYDQAQMTKMSTNQIMSEAKKRALLSEKENYAAPVNSTIDRDAQLALTGEINFDSEDEAKMYLKLTPSQQASYLKSRKSAEYLPSTSEASAQALPVSSTALKAGAALLALYFLTK